LNSIHNVHYYLHVMNGLQAAIEKGSLDDHIDGIYEEWGLPRALTGDISCD
jgi:queuine/archaeosine tRNA-ribosyltransferase